MHLPDFPHRGEDFLDFGGFDAALFKHVAGQGDAGFTFLEDDFVGARLNQGIVRGL